MTEYVVIHEVIEKIIVEATDGDAAIDRAADEPIENWSREVKDEAAWIQQ